MSQISVPRSGWRGAIIRNGRGSRSAKMAVMKSSSPRWVEAANTTSRPLRNVCQRFKSSGSASGGGMADLRLPTGSTGARRSVDKPVAVCWSLAITTENRENSQCDKAGQRRHPARLLWVIRAFISAVGSSRLSSSNKRFGQTSLSANTLKSGRQCATNRRAIAGVSTGAIIWTAARRLVSCA
ncbi:MAG: Uncharacterised protein [Hyphomonas sp. TMED17]|nr:MAG: Uncharacterised protein [Hyphomonas sp. TMED17]